MSTLLDIALDIAFVVAVVAVAGGLVMSLLAGLAKATDDDESETP